MDIFQIISAIGSSIITLSAALLVVWKLLLPHVRRSIEGVGERVEQVHYQVANDHKTNLREDIDELKTLLLEHFAQAEKDRSVIDENSRRIERIEDALIRKAS